MAEMDWERSTYEEGWDETMDRTFESLLQRVQSGGSLSKFNIVAGTGQVRIDDWKPGHIDLHIETPAGMKINLSQFYYPTWTASLVRESSTLIIQPSHPDGLISLSIPQGSQDVLFEMKRSKAEITGGIISLVSLIITLSYVAMAQHQYRKRQRC